MNIKIKVAKIGFWAVIVAAMITGCFQFLVEVMKRNKEPESGIHQSIEGDSGIQIGQSNGVINIGNINSRDQ